MLTPERWERIKDLFTSALARPVEERQKFLAEACGSDESIHEEIVSLLSAHEEDESFLEYPAYELAAEVLEKSRPELAAGELIGPYEILSLLGAGGMGQVYLAHDSRLGRNIALKLLTSDFAKDSQRVRRFAQEARTASSLNHSNVCVIYDVGRTDSGSHFIAMEYVEGVTLRRRMTRNRLTLSETLDVACQVAEALKAAHAAGIVHRDIKPENVMLRPDNHVKVLDFGVAKFARRSPKIRNLHVVSTEIPLHTEPGTRMGTVKYMSPEQLRELPIDVRTDIWSFGVVLHEMITGFTPFEAPTTNDTIAIILEKDEPNLDCFADDVPEEFRRIIRKALSKKRGERYQTMREFATHLENLRHQFSSEAGSVFFDQSTVKLEPPVKNYPYGGSFSSAPTIFSKARLQALSTANYLISEIKQHKKTAIFTCFSVVFVAIFISHQAGAFKRRQLNPNPPEMKMISLTNAGKSVCAAISPDGKLIAHVKNESGGQSLLLTGVATGGTSTLVSSGKYLYRGVTFSRDNNYLFFIRSEASEAGVLYQVALPGGTPRRIKEGVDSPVSFSPKGDRFSFVRFNRANGDYALMISSVDASDEQTIASRTDGANFSLSGTAWSADEKTIFCGAGWWDRGYHMNVMGFDIDGGQEKAVGNQQWFSIYQVAWLDRSNSLVISARERWTSPYQLWLVSYPKGETTKITNDTSEYESVSVSENGDIVSVRSQQVAQLWVAPEGDAQRAKPIASTLGYRYGLNWTSNGKIVFSSMVGSNVNISVINADGSNQMQLTSNAGDNYTPAVCSDDRYIVFASNRGGSLNIWRMNLEDGSDPKQLTFSDGNSYPSCSPDGKWIVYDNQSNAKATIWKVSIEGGSPVQLSDEYSRMPAISPNGQLVAFRYYDAASGLRGIAVLPFQGGPVLQRLPIPVMDWQRVQWSENSQALTYVDNTAGTPNLWSYDLANHQRIQLTDFKTDQIFAYAWSPDNKHLVCQHGSELRDVTLISNQK